MVRLCLKRDGASGGYSAMCTQTVCCMLGFFFNDTAAPEVYALSRQEGLAVLGQWGNGAIGQGGVGTTARRDIGDTGFCVNKEIGRLQA